MNDLNISLKQLRYYLVAAKHNSLRKAARELMISQPSLSAQLFKLEESLDIELFERSRGGGEPDASGQGPAKAGSASGKCG